MCDGDCVCGMVGGSLENDAQDAIVVGKGVVEAFQDHRPNTVPSAIYNDMLVSQTETVGDSEYPYSHPHRYRMSDSSPSSTKTVHD